jgi:hypothetical protein
MSGRTTTKRSAGRLRSPNWMPSASSQAGSLRARTAGTTRTIVTSRHRRYPGGDIERLVDQAGDCQRAAQWGFRGI